MPIEIEIVSTGNMSGIVLLLAKTGFWQREPTIDHNYLIQMIDQPFWRDDVRLREINKITQEANAELDV